MTKTKICFIDLDGTIIKTKSGETFPKDNDDWELKPKTIDLMKKSKLDGFKIVLVTNQAGISRGYISQASFAKKLRNIQEKMNLFFDKIFIATSLNSKYRKPKSSAHEESLNSISWEIDKKESFMVGDAGGKTKDFSNSDMMFAKSLGIRFLHVEDI
jgi:bifunctional polynucleotide phosphatase/kinase